MERKTKTILIAGLSILLVVVAIAIAVCVWLLTKGGDNKKETTDTVNNPESFKALVRTERFGQAKMKPRLKQPSAKEKRGAKPVSYLDSYIDSSV